MKFKYSRLTHLPQDKMAAISQTTFSDAFSSMKTYIFWFKFHWSLFLGVQLTIFQQWFREWLGADQATSHYLNQCWPDSLMHICGTKGRWVNRINIMTAQAQAPSSARPSVVMVLTMRDKWSLASRIYGKVKKQWHAQYICMFLRKISITCANIFLCWIK